MEKLNNNPEPGKEQTDTTQENLKNSKIENHSKVLNNQPDEQKLGEIRKDLKETTETKLADIIAQNIKDFERRLFTSDLPSYADPFSIGVQKNLRKDADDIVGVLFRAARASQGNERLKYVEAILRFRNLTDKYVFEQALAANLTNRETIEKLRIMAREEVGLPIYETTTIPELVKKADEATKGKKIAILISSFKTLVRRIFGKEE